MLRIEPNAATLGATIHGLDLRQPLNDAAFRMVLHALGQYAVLRLPNQNLHPRQLAAFSRRFGHIQTSVSGKYHHAEAPEVGILSNIIRNGVQIGIPDAGQDWHTDMSYTPTRGFINVLHAVEVPMRDGRPLGATLFADMRAAYAALPEDWQRRIEPLTATHDFNVFWQNMVQRPGSTRPPLTPAERARRPPATHPLVLRHPLSGQRVLYCNPGYAERINGVSAAESTAMLDFLFQHQLQPRFQYAHHWQQGDLLLWDHLATLHNAVADYGADEPRLMHRCQVMADQVFSAEFQRQWLNAA
jgi:taurine dioxygenase